MSFEIGIGANNRKSAYFDATVADGVASFSVYNHMFLPVHYGDPAAEYDSLMNGVTMWDVAAQRQVELAGPDVHGLVQYLTTRNVADISEGQGRYIPICDHAGRLINDPVLLRVAPDRFWMSIADSDIGLWASAIAAERELDVAVSEPDVSPLAVQGPKAVCVIRELFGPWIEDLKHFAFTRTELHGIPLILARSGWSKQGGFELYLLDGKHGTALWETIRKAGQPYGIRPGAPNDIERIESGLISYGADGRLQNNPCNPFEIGLGGLVDFDKPTPFVGRAALQQISRRGPVRKRVGFEMSGARLTAYQDAVAVHDPQGTEVGVLSEAIYSPRLARNIALGMVRADLGEKGQTLVAEVHGTTRQVTVTPLPFE